MKTIFSNKFVRYGLFIMAGLVIGWMLFHSPKVAQDEHDHSAEEAKMKFGLALCILKSKWINPENVRYVPWI